MNESNKAIVQLIIRVALFILPCMYFAYYFLASPKWKDKDYYLGLAFGLLLGGLVIEISAWRQRKRLKDQ